MADDLDVELVLADCPLEGRQLKTIRILGMILLEKFPDTHPLRARRDTYPGSKASNSILLEDGPDVGIPYRQTSHATAPRKGERN